MILSYQSLLMRRPVSPFCERTKFNGMTFGCGPAGYDIRIAEDIFLPGQSFVLASSLEWFRMPTDLLGIVHDKSTWARKGLALQNTVIEPGWSGYLTLELSNHTRSSIVIDAGSPIAQIIFHLLDEPTIYPYPQDGKYQNQKAGAQPAIFEDA